MMAQIEGHDRNKLVLDQRQIKVPNAAQRLSADVQRRVATQLVAHELVQLIIRVGARVRARVAKELA